MLNPLCSPAFDAGELETVESDYPFTPPSFAHRVFVDQRESPTSHCSDSSQNVSNLRSDVVETLRAVHDEIGAAAPYGLTCSRPANGSHRNSVGTIFGPQRVHSR
jgi:hypothetical protein